MSYPFQNNVKLLFGPGISPENRVFISNGTEPCDGDVVDGYVYEKRSFRPRHPWRSITPQEEEILYTSDTGAEFYKTISVVKMPDEIKQLALEAGIPELNNSNEIPALRKRSPKDYMQFVDRFKQEAGSYLFSENSLHNIGILAEPNIRRRTSTISIYTQMLIGMHMDSWEGMNVSDLDTAPNRICVNLGKEDRFFLFVNLTMNNVFELTKENSGLDRDTLAQDLLVINFFRQFPDYPVIRVRLKPFEAYIAPTENIIHDGCTEDKTLPDINYTIRGFFNISKNTKLATV